VAPESFPDVDVAPVELAFMILFAPSSCFNRDSPGTFELAPRLANVFLEDVVCALDFVLSFAAADADASADTVADSVAGIPATDFAPLTPFDAPVAVVGVPAVTADE
jgi:hypothetical protein